MEGIEETTNEDNRTPQENPVLAGGNAKHRFIKGQSGNPAGRAPGTLTFKTKWMRFIDRVAAKNDMTPDEVDENLMAIAYKKLQQGEYKFWKDIQDRFYGTATNNTDININGSVAVESLEEKMKKILAYDRRTNQNAGTSASPLQNRGGDTAEADTEPVRDILTDSIEKESTSVALSAHQIREILDRCSSSSNESSELSGEMGDSSTEREES